jgi:ParB family chromosome partitioning protein
MPELVNIPVDLLDDHEENAIFSLEEEGIAALAESVATRGVLQPLVVRKKPDGRYRIIAGHRRKYAAVRAGKTEVLCIIRDDDTGDDLVDLILTNLHARDITPMERARSYRAIKEHFLNELCHSGTAGQEGDQNIHCHSGSKGITAENDQLCQSGTDGRTGPGENVYCHNGSEPVLIKNASCHSGSERLSLAAYLKKLGISERSFYRYDSLNELIPELQKCVDKGVVSVPLAERLASKPPELQRLLYEALGEDIGKIPLEEVKKLKEETDRGYLVLELLQKKLSDLETKLSERERKEGEIADLEKQASQLRAKIRSLTYDLADRRAAAEEYERKVKKGSAALLDLVEKIGRPAAKARPEIEALLAVSDIGPNAATHLLKWAQVLVEVGRAVEAAAKKALIVPVESTEEKSKKTGNLKKEEKAL